MAGTILFVGLTWFQVFTDEKDLYAAALAFSLYGIHWFVLGWNRYRQNDPRPNAGMSVAYMVLSALGATVFFAAGDLPVGILFIGLFWVYFSDFFVATGVEIMERSLGLAHVLTGIWLMYLTFAVTVNFSLGYSWWV